MLLVLIAQERGKDYKVIFVAHVYLGLALTFTSSLSEMSPVKLHRM